MVGSNGAADFQEPKILFIFKIPASSVEHRADLRRRLEPELTSSGSKLLTGSQFQVDWAVSIVEGEFLSKLSEHVWFVAHWPSRA